MALAAKKKKSKSHSKKKRRVGTNRKKNKKRTYKKQNKTKKSAKKTKKHIPKKQRKKTATQTHEAIPDWHARIRSELAVARRNFEQEQRAKRQSEAPQFVPPPIVPAQPRPIIIPRLRLPIVV